jgi:membrane protease YdiL (CAAX protease family)
MDDAASAGEDSAASMAAKEEVLTVGEGVRGSRKLRVIELLLVVGSGYLLSTVGSVRAWVLGQAEHPDTSWISVARILDSGLAIALLAYVLYRQGRSLRSLGLTAKRSDLGWALVVLFLGRLVHTAIVMVFRPALPPEVAMAPAGPLEWLSVVPAAAMEDLTVRAFLITEVAVLTGNAGVAVLASVAFDTAGHLYQGTAAALVHAGVFFVYAVYYANQRRITPVILAHSLHNFLVLASRGG